MGASTRAAIQTTTVEYEYGGTRLKGYLARGAAATDRRPGVLVFPEWWGLDESARTRARLLAELGYVAFAADVYGEGRVIGTTRPGDAAAAAAALRANPGAWRGRTPAALGQLTGRPDVDASKVAAVGYCLESALQLAYTGAEVKAVATFHSVLPMPTDAEAKAIRAAVLVCVGGMDPFILPPAIEGFRAALGAAGVELDVITYPGVVHSFTSPEADAVGNPALRYDRDADRDSWGRMKALFAAALGTSEQPRTGPVP
ncbi:MAG: dienelactone hydrolase family protein [Gemmataceae bacterium]|nr:dienelactone hydrolase family protein [Gemmataceae bacterium]